MTHRSEPVKAVWHIEDSGPLVRVNSRNLPDLDDLMLDVYQWAVAAGDVEPWEEPLAYTNRDGKRVELGGDDATRIPGDFREAAVGWYRTNPCSCGEEHTFDMAAVPSGDDGRPIGTAARGAFLGVHFQ